MKEASGVASVIASVFGSTTLIPGTSCAVPFMYTCAPWLELSRLAFALAAAVAGARGADVPVVALPAGRVAAAAEPLAVVAAGAVVGAVVGAPLAVVAGFGVSVALLPPHAARIAAAAVPAMLPRKSRREM